MDELRARKLALQSEVKELEGLLSFDDPKQSLSALTGGISDEFISNKQTQDGQTKMAIKTAPLIKGLGKSLLGRNQNSPLIAFDNTNTSSNILETSLKLGTAALVGSLAKKSIKSKSWRNRILGLVLIYALPVALKYVRKELEEYQKNKSVSSLEKLI